MQFCVIDQSTKVNRYELLANVGIKNYASSKFIKVVIILATIGLIVISITKNNPKVTPRKRLVMLKNVEVKC